MVIIFHSFLEERPLDMFLDLFDPQPEEMVLCLGGDSIHKKMVPYSPRGTICLTIVFPVLIQNSHSKQMQALEKGRQWAKTPYSILEQPDMSNSPPFKDEVACYKAKPSKVPQRLQTKPCLAPNFWKACSNPCKVRLLIRMVTLSSKHTYHGEFLSISCRWSQPKWHQFPNQKICQW